jgi:hypothetical protein
VLSTAAAEGEGEEAAVQLIRSGHSLFFVAKARGVYSYIGKDNSLKINV